MGIASHAHESDAAPLRRAISEQQPMWILHIDTWNLADPQKIIDMVPEDIRPYVVFNLSLSINHREDRWLQVEYGYETAKSWLRTCAENRVWALVQPSSGAFCHFPDGDMTIFEEFFRDYPNFLGFNYCEQFWGFGDPYGVTFEQRLDHWADLMELNVKYGGYLVWSWCNAYYDADRNAIALMKRNERLRRMLLEHPENFIACEKYTMNHGFHENESVCLGAWLGGYAGHYGTRFDETGWRGNAFREPFPVSAGPAPVLEHLLLTGQTVVDGPETIPKQACHEIDPEQLPDGFTARRWTFYPQFHNIYIDIFRKILDGTVRLLSREEVLARTKVALIHDINVESDDRDVLRGNYIAPEGLYEGLYKMPGDGEGLRQNSWFKSTGRYAAIPIVYALKEDAARAIPVQVKVSEYATRWPSQEDKVREFNALYPQEYTGDVYAAHAENCWVIYNPFKTGQSASGVIPLQYNGCTSLEVALPRYSTLLAKEYADRIDFYFNNYDNAIPQPRTDTVYITGVKGKASYSLTDRLDPRDPGDVPAQVRVEQKKGVYTLYVTHNGPVDLTVSCKGSAKDRKTGYTQATLHEPAIPPVYVGPHQYEAENFDYKDIEENVTNGIGKPVRNYTAQGYLRLGGHPSAQIRKTVRTLEGGRHALTLRYSAPEGPRTILLAINGHQQRIELPAADTWQERVVCLDLNQGDNELRIAADGASDRALLLDNVVLERQFTDKDYSAYLMVYFKEYGHHVYFAVSRDGRTFTDVNGGEPAMRGDTLAQQKGIRDPHLYRGPDNAFYLAMTDLHIYAKQEGYRDTEWEREGYGWGNNRALVLMKSRDLIHWKRANVRFDLTYPEQLSEVSCVWAPCTVWDEEAGKLLVTYTMAIRGQGGPKLYYSYVNDDYDSLLTFPQRLFTYPGDASCIDSDISRVGDKYHLFYVSHEGVPGIKHAVSDRANGGYVYEPAWCDPEDGACEGPTLWKQIGEERWTLMYDVYSARPNNMGFSETTDFAHYRDLGLFNKDAMHTTNFESPKHGAVVPLTESELKALENYWHFDL